MCTVQVDARVESETSFVWLKDSEQLKLEEKYSLLSNKSLLLHNITLQVRTPETETDNMRTNTMYWLQCLLIGTLVMGRKAF